MSVLAVSRRPTTDPHTPTPEKILNYAKGPCTKCECSKFTSSYYALCTVCGHLEYLHAKRDSNESSARASIEVSVSLADNKDQGTSATEEESSSSSSSEEEGEKDSKG